MSKITVTYTHDVGMDDNNQAVRTWVKEGGNCHFFYDKEDGMDEGMYWFICDDSTFIIKESQVLFLELEGKNEDDGKKKKK